MQTHQQSSFKIRKTKPRVTTRSRIAVSEKNSDRSGLLEEVNVVEFPEVHLIHSCEDTTVSVQQSVQFYEALRDHGVDLRCVKQCHGSHSDCVLGPLSSNPYSTVYLHPSTVKIMCALYPHTA